jgi:hypothetical protein
MTSRFTRCSAAAYSLRRSAGGANEEAVPRARFFHPTTGLGCLLAVAPFVAEPGPLAMTNGFSVHRSLEPHAPSTDSILGSITDQLVKVDPSPRGPRRPFGLCLPWHPSARLKTNCPVPGNWPLPSLRLCASWGLAAFPWTQRQDASNPFLQPTFHATSTHDKHHLWRPFAERRGKPANVRLRDRPSERDRTRRPGFLGRRRTTLRSSGLQRLRA